MVASDRRKWLALALLSVVQFMVVLDIAIVNVALPSIQVDLGFSERNLQWVISAYALVFGGFLLLGGRNPDLGTQLVVDLLRQRAGGRGGLHPGADPAQGKSRRARHVVRRARCRAGDERPLLVRLRDHQGRPGRLARRYDARIFRGGG